MDIANVSGGTDAGFTGPPTTVNIDNANGQVTLNTFQTSAAPSGTFTVAKLVFTPIAQGSSNLALSNRVLTDTAGQELLQPPAQIYGTANSVTVIRVP